MSTYLVTGAAGFIGSHVSRVLLERGDAVVGLDEVNDYYNVAQKRTNLKTLQKNDRFTFIEKDIREQETFLSVFAEHPEIGTVIHLAARAGVRPSIEDPQLYVMTNVLGTTHLLEAMRVTERSCLVNASSSSVYGNRSKVPFSEKDRVDTPFSPYAATKKATELLCSTYHELYNLSVASLRFFTVYGPSGRPDMAPFKFVSKILNGEPIQRYGNGTTERDYTFIDDIVAGVIASAAFVEQGGKNEIFNLGNASPVTLNRFIQVIETAAGEKAVIEELPMQPGDVTRTYADVSKAEELLGYRPKTSIEEGMQVFVEWFKRIQ